MKLGIHLSISHFIYRSSIQLRRLLSRVKRKKRYPAKPPKNSRHAIITRGIFWTIIYVVAAVMTLGLFALTARGSVGNPTPHDVEYTLNSSGQPFETSQERSRWALLLSIVHNHTVAIDSYASMGTPDVGRIKGHYFSLFPPGLSIAATPLYLIGEAHNASQLYTFLTPAIFTICTMILLIAFARRLGLSHSISLFAAFAYAFATSAWGYSITLFAHTASGFFLLLGIYLTSTNGKSTVLRSVTVWICYCVALFIDFPNVFIYFPIALFEGLKLFSISKETSHSYITIHWRYIIGPLIFIAALAGYGYYNTYHFGNPLMLSNALPRVKDLKNTVLAEPEKFKNSGQALKTRNIVNGLYTFIASPDRSVLVYTPAILLFLFGLGYLKKIQKQSTELLLFSIPATCFVLYTMFGDPYGGWAFGSRYLVAIMPELILLGAVGLFKFRSNVWVKILYTATVLYSSYTVLLAPLTTNVIPPKIEADPLGLEYTYSINWRMLQNNQLSSYIYNTWAHTSMNGMQYYVLIATVLTVVFIALIWGSAYEHTHTE